MQLAPELARLRRWTGIGRILLRRVGQICARVHVVLCRVHSARSKSVPAAIMGAIGARGATPSGLRAILEGSCKTSASTCRQALVSAPPPQLVISLWATSSARAAKIIFVPCITLCVEVTSYLGAWNLLFSTVRMRM
jgi:hypothetical protein